MTQHSASGSLVVRRIIKNDTLSLYMEQSGLPFFQGYDQGDKSVTPTWSSATGKHPIATPKINSAKGTSYVLTEHTWMYNGQDLRFNSKSTSESWVASEVDSRFEYQGSTGSIRVVDNLASESNQDSDTLTYTGVAKAGESSYTLTLTLDITLCALSSSSYMGTIQASPSSTVSKDQTSVNLSTHLYNGNGEQTDYTVQWYKDTEADGTGKTKQVSRDDIDSQQLYIAKFYFGGSLVATAGITIVDIDDQFMVSLYKKAGETGVDEDNTVHVFGNVVNRSTMKVQSIAASSMWQFSCYKASDSSPIASSVASMTQEAMASGGYAVTDAYTKDADGNVYDVTVNGEVTFEI